MAIVYAPAYPFRQTGPPQYIFGGFDLDRLVIPYRGARPLLDAFLASAVATPWVPSEYDPAMFLSGYSVGADKVAPEVQLQYLGKKGGILTPGKHENDDAVLSASSSSSGIIGTALLSDPVTVEYYAPRRTLSWISKEEGALGSIEDVADPGGTITGAITVVWTVALASPGVNYTVGNLLSGSDPSSGSSFRVQVTRLGLSGSILTYSIVNINPPLGTLTPANPITASGGSGTGAEFDIIQSVQFPISGLGIRIISLTWRSAEFTAFGSDLLKQILNIYFHPVIIQTTKSDEVVSGQYWLNTRTKTRVLQPGSLVFSEPPGGIQL